MREIVTTKLSSREIDVINAIIQDGCFTYDDIASKLYISKTTVSRHLEHIYLKLELPTSNISALVWHYYNKGIEENINESR